MFQFGWEISPMRIRLWNMPSTTAVMTMTNTSRSSQGIFDGEIRDFDPDFWERGIVEPSNDLSELVEPFSYGETFEVENIKLNKSYNTVIYKYEISKEHINAPVEFIAAVPYENLDL